MQLQIQKFFYLFKNFDRIILQLKSYWLCFFRKTKRNNKIFLVGHLSMHLFYLIKPNECEIKSWSLDIEE